MAPLTALLLESEHDGVLASVRAALQALDPSAWRAAEAERASRARGLSRAGQRELDAERGLSRAEGE